MFNYSEVRFQRIVTCVEEFFSDQTLDVVLPIPLLPLPGVCSHENHLCASARLGTEQLAAFAHLSIRSDSDTSRLAFQEPIFDFFCSLSAVPHSSLLSVHARKLPELDCGHAPPNLQHASHEHDYPETLHTGTPINYQAYLKIGSLHSLSPHRARHCLLHGHQMLHLHLGWVAPASCTKLGTCLMTYMASWRKGQDQALCKGCTINGVNTSTGFGMSALLLLYPMQSSSSTASFSR